MMTLPARAISAFKTAERTAPTYRACLSGRCQTPVAGEHCPDCKVYLEASRELNAVLGIQPWETSPVEVDDSAIPDWIRDNPTALIRERAAQKLRRALKEEVTP